MRDSDVSDNVLPGAPQMWVVAQGGIATVGVAEHVLAKTGRIVFVELPEVGWLLDEQDPICALETADAMLDLPSPVSGEVIEVNGGLIDRPRLINKDPYGGGWIAKLKLTQRPGRF